MKKIPSIMDNGEQGFLCLRTTKEDILLEVDEMRKMIIASSKSDEYHSSAYYHTMLGLLDRFVSGIDELILFNELEDFWEYDVVIGSNSIALNLTHNDPIYVEDELIGSFIPDQIFTLYEVQCASLTVEEYADKYRVETATVRQWIRRGKIRTAYKVGNEWRIPELTDLPRRGATPAHYEWDEKLVGLPEEYSFLNKFDRVCITQNIENKREFNIELSIPDPDKEYYLKTTRMKMSTKDKERFELFLISNPQVQYLPHFTEGLMREMMEYYK